MRDVERESALGDFECQRGQHAPDKRKSERHSPRGDEGVKDGERGPVDGQDDRLAQPIDRFEADRGGRDRLLDCPVGEVNRRADQDRPRRQTEHVDEDTTRERARRTCAPDRVDLGVHLGHEQHGGDHDKDGAHSLEVGRLGDELVQVVANGEPAARQERAHQQPFERALETVEEREPGDVGKGHGEQRHESQQRRERQARGGSGEVDAVQPPPKATQEGNERADGQEHR